MQTLETETYRTIAKEASQRGATVQELLRAVIIPEWLTEGVWGKGVHMVFNENNETKLEKYDGQKKQLSEGPPKLPPTGEEGCGPKPPFFPIPLPFSGRKKGRVFLRGEFLARWAPRG